MRVRGKKSLALLDCLKQGATYSLPVALCLDAFGGLVDYNSLLGISKSEDADCCLTGRMEQPLAWSRFSRGPRLIDSLNVPSEGSMGGRTAGCGQGFLECQQRREALMDFTAFSRT